MVQNDIDNCQLRQIVEKEPFGYAIELMSHLNQTRSFNIFSFKTCLQDSSVFQKLHIYFIQSTNNLLIYHF